MVEVGVPGEGHAVALVRGHRGPRPVGGQFQLLGQPSESAAPVVDLAGDEALRIALVAEHLALPERVVGVLHRQGRPLRSVSVAAGCVRDGEIVGERSE